MTKTLISVLLWALAGYVMGAGFGANVGWSVFTFGLLLMIFVSGLQLSRVSRWAADIESPPPPSVGPWDDVLSQIYRKLRRDREQIAQLKLDIRRMLQAAEALPDGAATLDGQMQLTWCNRSARKHLGLKPKADIGHSIFNIVRHPEFARYARQNDWSEPVEMHVASGDQSLTLLVQLVNYGIDRYLLVSRDITQLERLETTRKDFVANVSHELRTPLTVLLGHIDVGLRRLRTPEEYSEILRLLREHTAQLQKIVTSLLFLARADEDTSLPDSETIWLDEWLSDYVKRWADHPRHDDIVLHASESHACAVTASTALLARLMDNLVENALKYSPPGSRVDIELSKAENEALIAVQDHGRGIPAEDQSAIFAPFYRSRAAREAGIAGTGLGLAIAARIAEVSGGQIACTSVPEQGSRFVVRLPLANPATIRRDTSAGEWLVRR